MKFKICIWMNIPSHHQSAFFEALDQHCDVDIQVRYFDKINDQRLALGWKNIKVLKSYEKYIENLDEGLKKTPDWKERIHIIMGSGFKFNQKLINLCISNNLQWIHWSERFGVALAKKVNYNIFLFNLLKPLLLFRKKVYGNIVNKYALGAFSQGKLAHEDFLKIGIHENKIQDLYYSLNPLKNSDDIPEKLQLFNFKHKFLYVGSLYKRKGVDILLKAFASINSDEWGLVLVGNGKEYENYVTLASKLNITTRVLFAGTENIESINMYYSSCDVLILPSRYDGWGAVLNEGASLGLPLIASDQCGSAYHVLQNSKNGFRVKAGKVKNMATAMKKYINNPNLLQKHGENSKNIFQNFTPEMNVKRFIEALKQWIEHND